MKVIGITGRAGCGKSLLSKMLARKGVDVLDLDEIGHEVLRNARAEIEKAFGSSVFNNGKIDRNKLGNIAFSDRDSLDKLNCIIHPLIKKKVVEYLGRTSSGLVVIDGALIHQIGLAELCDFIAWIDCPAELARERLVKRGMSLIKADLVTKNQSFLENYKTECNLILENISSPEALLKSFNEALASWNVVL